MKISAIEIFLKNTIGLDPESVGHSTIRRAVHQRMHTLKLPSLQDYHDHFFLTAAEQAELVEAVLVPETSFFRHPESFTQLAECTRQRLESHPGKPVNLLSVPCASGEEPYSMAITLLEAGHSGQFAIDAIDISSQLLARAQTGLYTKNSFRSPFPRLQEKYFEQQNSQFVLKESVRQLVRFRQGNILQLSECAPPESYDIIFCRNLLIYFDQPTQLSVIHSLRHILAAEGFLFIGPAESNLLLTDGFVSTCATKTFCFKKASPKPKPKPAARPAPRSVTRTPLQPPAPPPARPSSPIKSAPRPAPAATPDLPDLEKAARLADQGQLPQAAKICENQLALDPTCVPALYLLGLIRDASGQSEAARACYKKVIYLQPDHYEALIHLALLCNKLGDPTAAKVLHERANRLKKKSGATRKLTNTSP